MAPDNRGKKRLSDNSAGVVNEELRRLSTRSRIIFRIIGIWSFFVGRTTATLATHTPYICYLSRWTEFSTNTLRDLVTILR